MSYVAVAGRFLIGTIFVVALLAKAGGSARFVAFTGSLRRMQILPSRLVRPVAVGVLLVEGLVVLLLAVPGRTTAVAGLALATLVLMGFGAATALAVLRGVDASCPCFGRSSSPLGWLQVTRNAGLAAVAVVGVIASSVDQPASRPGLLVAGAIGVILGGLVVELDDILAVFRQRREPRSHRV